MNLGRRVSSVLSIVLAASLLATAVAVAPATAAKKPGWTANCTALNKKYPHGLGRSNARDKTSPGNKPVTNFKRSTRLYKLAMSHNKGLDRDRDGVACEKS